MERPDIAELLSSLYHPGLKTIEPGLERMEALLRALGNPEARLPPVIHVAGTNGKGSLVAYLQAIFQAAGMRVHRYTSPHLVRFNERIVLAGAPVEDDALLALLQRVKAHIAEHPATFFEATTAAAFLAFSETPANIVLLETGMGGRLDSTNVLLAPALTAITPISLDHMEYLGNDLRSIAFEKACIMRPGGICVVGPQAPEALAEIRRVSLEMESDLFICGENWKVEETPTGGLYRSFGIGVPFMPALPGKHQIYNAATAIACLEALGMMLPPEVIVQGIASAQWPARLQRLHGALAATLPESCELWLDGGHNPGAGEVLGAWAGGFQDKPLVLVCGMIQGKDTAGFLSPLAARATQLIALTIPDEPTSQSAEAIAASAQALGIRTEIAPSLRAALEMATQKDGMHCRILICGSLYLAGKVLLEDAL